MTKRIRTDGGEIVYYGLDGATVSSSTYYRQSKAIVDRCLEEVSLHLQFYYVCSFCSYKTALHWGTHHNFFSVFTSQLGMILVCKTIELRIQFKSNLFGLSVTRAVQSCKKSYFKHLSNLQLLKYSWRSQNLQLFINESEW